ncbi:MAG: hypothetical protein ABEI11_04565 [Haloarculaceae archaeon]
MTRPRPVAVAVACAWLLATAGCSGAVGGAGREPTATLTPAPIPEEPAGELAPGIGERRVTDPEVAATVHRSVLGATSYRVTHERTVEGPNGTLHRVRWRVTVVPERRAYAINRSERTAPTYLGGGPDADIAVWYSDGTARNRFVPSDGRPRYWGYEEEADGRLRSRARAETAVSTLAAFEYRVADERTVDGTRRYTLRGTRLVRPARLDVPAVLAAPRDATLDAVVTEAGMVRSFELRYRARYRERPVTVRSIYRVSAVGTATLPRPAWLAAANESVVGEDGRTPEDGDASP